MQFDKTIINLNINQYLI